MRKAFDWDGCSQGMVRILKDQWLALAIATTSLGLLIWLELVSWAVS